MFDLNFWFSIPSLRLQTGDLILGYIFAGITILSIMTWISRMFVQHEIKRKFLRKVFSLLFSIGLLGLFWFVLRFESTPIFSTRYWVGLVILAGLIWLGFVVKYFVFNFQRERREHDEDKLKKKYLPG